MKSALVLEGGSLRCMFSAGIVDVLMEHGVEFNGVFGVSAGSLTGINFVSKQPARTKNVNICFVQDERYLGIKSLLKSNSIFNFDFLFSEISDIYLPLDWEAFRRNPTSFTACVTGLETGAPIYFNKNNCDNIAAAIRASSSMPLLAPPVEVDGTLCLDGGISMAIPYQKALDEGYDKILVIPTREHGFRKKQPPSAIMRLYVNRYYKYPAFLKTLLAIPRMYARQMDEVDKLALQGKIKVIRPRVPITISRTEKNTSKLLALYEEGRKIGIEQLPTILQYLNA